MKKKPTSKSKSKRTPKPKPKPRPYVLPKTAAELGITCRCGQPCLWFDYQLGEKSHLAGFVCEEHRVSRRVERLALPQEPAARMAVSDGSS